MSKRDANKRRNEQEILATAIRLFISKGAEETTIGDIVASTSLARGTFYNYFKDKKEIWDKIITDLIDNLNQKAFRKRAESTTIHDFIYDSFLEPLSVFDKPPYRELIAKNPSAFRDAFFKNEEIGVIISIFERDMRASSLFKNLPDYFYKMTAYSMVGSCLEILIQSQSNRDNFTIKQITEYITLIFEKSLESVQLKSSHDVAGTKS